MINSAADAVAADAAAMCRNLRCRPTLKGFESCILLQRLSFTLLASLLLLLLPLLLLQG
jgi:hypothetical protein